MTFDVRRSTSFGVALRLQLSTSFGAADRHEATSKLASLARADDATEVNENVEGRPGAPLTRPSEICPSLATG